MKILVIEDDRKIASFLAKGLREECHGVDLSPDGGDELIKARLHAYDLLLLDVMLPSSTGVEIVRELLSC